MLRRCSIPRRRVTALKVLCELRLERADIRNRLEAAEIMRHNRRKVSPGHLIALL